MGVQRRRARPARQQASRRDQVIDGLPPTTILDRPDLGGRDAIYRDDEAFASLRTPNDLTRVVPQLADADPFHEP